METMLELSISPLISLGAWTLVAVDVADREVAYDGTYALRSRQAGLRRFDGDREEVRLFPALDVALREWERLVEGVPAHLREAPEEVALACRRLLDLPGRVIGESALHEGLILTSGRSVGDFAVPALVDGAVVFHLVEANWLNPLRIHRQRFSLASYTLGTAVVVWTEWTFPEPIPGEPEFLIRGPDAGIRVWGGWFSEVVETLVPGPDGWRGIALAFHTLTGWDEAPDSQWTDPDPADTLAQLVAAEGRCPDGTARAFRDAWVALLRAAVERGGAVVVTYV